jgi:preprotein translocase subunit YajC
MPAYIFLLVLLALVWLLLIRPRQRAMRTQQRQLQSLEVGDEILTAGGIYGTVLSEDGDELRVRIAPDVEIRVARRAVAAVISEPPTEPDQQQPALEAAETQDETPEATLSERERQA